MDFMFAERYVVVNIPAAFVEAVANDKVERRYRVIVGKIDKPSPTLAAYITAINLNPTWTVPLSITKTEIATTCAATRPISAACICGVLGAHDEEIDPRASIGRRTVRRISPSGRIPATGTRSAISRSICRIRIRFTCTTPTRESCSPTITASIRTAARGSTMCAILPPGFSRTDRRAGIAPRSMPASPPACLKSINLPHKMPVAWVYLTGWVTRDGTVEFRDDVYKHDEPLDRNALAEAAAGGFVAPLPATSSRCPIDNQ